LPKDVRGEQSVIWFKKKLFYCTFSYKHPYP
jgi:hypothetical protein